MKLDWPLFNLWLKNKEKATPNKNMLYKILFIRIVFVMFFLNIFYFYY
jgi:t-SNARE complex subunit (syntaxin)